VACQLLQTDLFVKKLISRQALALHTNQLHEFPNNVMIRFFHTAMIYIYKQP